MRFHHFPFGPGSTRKLDPPGLLFDLESFTRLVFSVFTANHTLSNHELRDSVRALRPQNRFMCTCFLQAFQELNLVDSIDDILLLPLGNDTMANLTKHFHEQMKCQMTYLHGHVATKGGYQPLAPSTHGNCGTFYDGISCWPEAMPNETISVSCPEKLEGTLYDSSQNATRICLEYGIWADKADYSACRPLEIPDTAKVDVLDSPHLLYMYYVYWVGYTTSLIFLILALVIFVSYRSLWCLRNGIHINLISCFGCHNIVWIFYSLFGHEFAAMNQNVGGLHICILPTTILKFFTAAGFFWMFLEGAYLFVSVMFSFHTQKIRFWMCCVLGWVVPFVLIFITSIVKGIKEKPEECWNEIYHLDYIFIGPVLLVLLINLIFLFIIMYVVFTKLQVTVRVEARRYRKTIKALVILCPLLGVNYILVLVPPTDPVWLKVFFSYFVAVMSSLQGLLVAVFFCFFSSEVKQAAMARISPFLHNVGMPFRRTRGLIRSHTQNEFVHVDNGCGRLGVGSSHPQHRQAVKTCSNSSNDVSKYVPGSRSTKSTTASSVIMMDDHGHLYLRGLSPSASLTGSVLNDIPEGVELITGNLKSGRVLSRLTEFLPLPRVIRRLLPQFFAKPMPQQQPCPSVAATTLATSESEQRLLMQTGNNNANALSETQGTGFPNAATSVEPASTAEDNADVAMRATSRRCGAATERKATLATFDFE